MNRNQFAASNPARNALRGIQKKVRKRAAKFLAVATYGTAEYPAVPAGWPNRATRRAVQQGRMSRVSGPWGVVLGQRPYLIDAIKALR